MSIEGNVAPACWVFRCSTTEVLWGRRGAILDYQVGGAAFRSDLRRVVAAEEVHQMLDGLVGSGALGYRKLFDGSRGDTSMGALDMLDIGARMRTLHAGAALGPLAVVIPEDKYVLLSRVLGMLASARRLMRIFSDGEKARRWLNSHVVRARVPPETVKS